MDAEGASAGHRGKGLLSLEGSPILALIVKFSKTEDVIGSSYRPVAHDTYPEEVESSQGCRCLASSFQIPYSILHILANATRSRSVAHSFIAQDIS